MNTKSLRQFMFRCLSVSTLLMLALSPFGGVFAQEFAPIDGFHDGESGDVRSTACDANGWAVDPDDRYRDVPIQVFSDDELVLETMADLERGLPDETCPDGTCGYHADLWGLITPGEPHEIRVKAYDQESEQWLDLESTPKMLTCWGYPEGFHDGNEGLVGASYCSAFGWAVDPDDRDRDLQVRLLSDEVEVTSTTANLYRDDMDTLGICPGGTCGWFADLWGLISPDQEHLITAQAYDDETSAWLDLEATPKALTCLTPAPLTLVVNMADDVDDKYCTVEHCSLREAIHLANGNPGPDTIAFNIPGDSPFTIQPQSALPDITDPVTIDGTTQPGDFETPVIELDGSEAGEVVGGLVIWAGETTVRGLVINRFSGDGIVLTSNGGNTIQGNYIGTDLSGTIAYGNYRGILIEGGSSNNLIGGIDAGAGNLISGNNAAGIRISDAGTEGNQVQGNFIGTDITGTSRLGNNLGVRITNGAANNVIGGAQEAARNLISGNDDIGVYMDVEEGEGTTGNLVQGNYIGTDVTGSATAGPAVGEYTVTSLDETCPPYPPETDFDGFVSQTDDPLGPWSWTPVTFLGTDVCGSPETIGAASLIYRYRLEFTEETHLTSIAIAGAAFNGPDSVLRVLDEYGNVLGSTDTFGGNSFQVLFVTLQDVVGKVFYVDEFDTSTTWRYHERFLINASPLGNYPNGIMLNWGSYRNLIADNLVDGNMGSGVVIGDSADNLIEGNLLSGNGDSGIDLSGAGSTGNLIADNQVVGNLGSGVTIGNSADNLIEGNLLSGNGGSGINLWGAGSTGNLIRGNRIGTDADGTAPLPNYDGIWLGEGANHNTIGGTVAEERNLISGNTIYGISVNYSASENQIIGNYIGTDRTGSMPLGNNAGGVILTQGSNNNTIGGLQAGAGNLISGNAGDGVVIVDSGTTSNIVQGNFLGTDATGTIALGNLRGVVVDGGSSGNLIGGTEVGAGNLISGNVTGIRLSSSGNTVQGNLIGTDVTGVSPLGNGYLGIRITDGATGNLIGGVEPGARNLISGNRDSGVLIDGGGTTGNIVQGNYIGTDVTGTNATGPAGPPVGEFTFEIMPESCPIYPAGTDFDGFISESDDPLAPWSGTSVTFLGTDECTDREKFGESSLIYRYRLEFEEVTELTSILVSGAAFNGPDNYLLLLDEDRNLLGYASTFGGNSFQSPYIVLSGVEGRVFYIEEFDTSTTWRFRQSIVVNGPLPMGNYVNGVLLAGGASGNLIGGAEPGARNLISGNVQNGVGIFNSGTTGNTIEGNYIGTDVIGTQALGNGAPGVGIGDQAFDNLVIGNLISGNRSDGVAIFNPGTTGNALKGNFIGTDASGTAALPNAGAGVGIGNEASNNFIGGAGEGEGNLISGNEGDGVFLYDPGTTRNIVQGNLIGTDLTGMLALGNFRGVTIEDGPTGNLIGGTEPDAGNLISGNWAAGVRLSGEGTEGNQVQGNFIGTDLSGIGALGNGYPGVRIADSAANNLVGGTGPGAGNTIAFNGMAGIAVDFGAGSGNSLLSNSVFSNASLGIDLGDDGVTPNDPLDEDLGPNDLQNSPNIIAVRRAGRAVMIYGWLGSLPSTRFRLEFFSNEACDESGNGEGQAFLGFGHVRTNQAGIARFIITLPVSLPPGAFVTATATDLAGSTSEFSNCVSPWSRMSGYFLPRSAVGPGWYRYELNDLNLPISERRLVR